MNSKDAELVVLVIGLFWSCMVLQNLSFWLMGDDLTDRRSLRYRTGWSLDKASGLLWLIGGGAAIAWRLFG